MKNIEPHVLKKNRDLIGPMAAAVLLLFEPIDHMLEPKAKFRISPHSRTVHANYPRGSLKSRIGFRQFVHILDTLYTKSPMPEGWDCKGLDTRYTRMDNRCHDNLDGFKVEYIYDFNLQVADTHVAGFEDRIVTVIAEEPDGIRKYADTYFGRDIEGDQIVKEHEEDFEELFEETLTEAST